MSKEKKLIIQIVIFIAVLISITFLYNFLVRKDNLGSNKGDKSMEIIEIENSKEFEKEVLDEKGTVLVDFYAIWCMPCKEMSPIVEEIASEYTDVKVVKVDVDKNEELAIKYNVMSIPTILIIKDGKEAKKFVGLVNKNKIIKEL